MPVSLAAPGAFLLRAGLVGPAVFFLPHPLGEDAQYYSPGLLHESLRPSGRGQVTRAALSRAW